MQQDKTAGKKLPCIISLLIYAACIALFVIWSNVQARREVYREIDEKLVIAATGLKYLIAPDFHDRAVSPDSISMAEELKNRETITRYAVDSGFKWLYTVIESDGKFYFGAPTVTEEEAREVERWYFYPYDDIPRAFLAAYNTNSTVYSTYTDHWGEFRSIAKAETAPGGRRYLACADVEITFVRSLLINKMWESLATAALFLCFSIPFIIAMRRVNCSFNDQLEQINRELSDHKDHLEIIVEERTADLKTAKEKSDNLVSELERALEEVKTLRGFLPICSKCKRIRDDGGYWQQIEQYIQERSDAEFSHGICPDCLNEMDPKLAQRVFDRIKVKNGENSE